MNLIRFKSLSGAILLPATRFLPDIRSGRSFLIRLRVFQFADKIFALPNPGLHLRYYASAGNGRKNGKNRATVNSNYNNNNDTDKNNGSSGKKPLQNASSKATKPNLPNKQLTQPMKSQSTINVADEIDKSTAKVFDTKISKGNAQNKPNDNGKPPAKTVNSATIFGLEFRNFRYVRFVDSFR